MKIVMIAEPKQCDLCVRQAEYDAKTVHGPWANLCQGCYESDSVAYPREDTELAFRLVVGDEPPVCSQPEEHDLAVELIGECPYCGQSA